MNRYLITAALIAAPLVATQAQTPTTAAAYVKAAGASDKYEMESSKLVLQTTKNEAIRSFATMMVTDHSKSTADVKAAATGAGMTVAPPMLDATGTRNVAALRIVKGAARDRLYLMQQKTAHQKALTLHQTYATSGDTPALKTVAGSIAPVVQHHIEMLQGL